MSPPAIPKVPLDTYTLRARLLPTLVVGLPLGLAALAWFPRSQSWWGPVSGLVIGAGGLALLAQLGRDWGKRKQGKLYDLWGGAPTTRLLRYRDPLNNQVLLARRHARLQELLPDQKIPTPEEERADPQRADDVYEASTAFLKEKTRNTQQFPLIFEENCNYGFRRNLWGMKPLGIVTSAGGAIAVAALVVIHYRAPNLPMSSVTPTALVLNSLLLLVWLFWFTPAWVKIAADAYAERLLAASDTL
jgi:hypothetical protein